MMMAEGVARQLNPEADMWGLARPLAGDWMQGQANFSRRAETFAEEAFALMARLPRILARLEAEPSKPAELPSTKLPLFLSCLAVGLALIVIFT